MQIYQHAYLRVSSDRLNPEQITALLGIEPDEVKRQGSLSLGPPPVPRSHSWTLTQQGQDLQLDAQLVALLDRATPAIGSIRALHASGDAYVTFQVVRQFGPFDADLEIVPIAPLGFHLAAELIARLASFGIPLDFDEYGWWGESDPTSRTSGESDPE